MRFSLAMLLTAVSLAAAQLALLRMDAQGWATLLLIGTFYVLAVSTLLALDQEGTAGACLGGFAAGGVAYLALASLFHFAGGDDLIVRIVFHASHSESLKSDTPYEYRRATSVIASVVLAAHCNVALIAALVGGRAFGNAHSRRLAEQPR